MTQTGAAARPPLEDTTESMLEWARENSRALTIGLVVIAAIIVGTTLYRRSVVTRESRADQALMGARQSYQSGNIPLAQSDLQKMVVRYDGTPAADQGNMLLAQLLFDQGKYADGLKQLDKVSGGDSKAAAEAMRGTGLELTGKPAEAVQHYLAAADKAPMPADKDAYRADAARVLGATGKTTEAIKIWSALAGDDKSFYSAEARVRIGELSAKPAAKS
jgi:predicted negative regulator of RcsB-dependent stress response